MAELYTYKGVGTGVLNLQLWRAELGTAAGEWGGIIIYVRNDILFTSWGGYCSYVRWVTSHLTLYFTLYSVNNIVT